MMDIDTLSPEARMWGAPGRSYEGISFGLSDTISHTVQALWPRPGEKILDIGTGTGWGARLAAWRGADVTGVDIAPGMLDAAETLSAGLEPHPVFQHGAAEALPFDDESFDGVISTYGVIFSSEPARTAAEIARVLRPGGRLALATWADDPEGYIAGITGLVRAWSDRPPPPISPFDWGRPDWLQGTLGPFFEIEVREQVTTLYAPDVATVWEEYVRGFGPVAATHAALQPNRREAFRAAFENFHRPYETALGLTIPRLALVVRGVRF
jgi:SAM-dependent methyltransferase